MSFSATPSVPPKIGISSSTSTGPTGITGSTVTPSLFHLDTTSELQTSLGTEAPRKPYLLIVDDEEGPRQSLRIVFKNDYNILLADSGNKAVELVKQHSVDAAVLDIRMSGMSGVELLGKLKEIDPTIEVIMLTAYETIET